MIEAYKVTTELVIKGNANNAMKLFAKLTKFANIELKELQKTLKLITGNFSLLSKDLRTVNPEFKILNKTFTTLNPKLFNSGLNFEAMSRHVKTLIPEISTLKTELAGLKGVSRIKISGGMGGIGGGEIGAVEGAGFGFGAGKFIKGMGGAGMLGLGAAGGAGYALAHGFGQNKTFEQQLNLLRFQGFNPSKLNQVRALALNPPAGFSPTDVVSAAVAAQMATQNFASAKQLMNPLLQAEYVANTNFGGMNQGQLQALARAGELRGHGNGKEIATWISNFMKIYALSGGTLDFRQLSQMSKQGFLAFTGQSFKGIAGSEPIAQVMGGGPFGTAMAGLMKTMHGVQLTGSSIKKVVAFMTALDMWNPKGGGKFGALKPQFMNQIQTDMPDFILNSLMPAMQKKFNIPNTEAGRNTMAQMLGIFHQNQGRMLGIGITQSAKIRNTQATLPFLESLSAMSSQSHASPAGALKDLTAAWNNFTQALEKTVQPIIIPLLNTLTSALNAFQPAHKDIVTAAAVPGYYFMDRIISHFTKKNPIVVNNYIDGKKIADNTVKTIVKRADAGGVQSNTSGFNPLINMRPVPAGALR